MKKNVGSQVIGVQMVSATDGSAFTGSATVVITGDGGTQSASGGTGPTHEGNGYHTYIPTQAETNYDLIGFTFTGSGAVPVTVQVFTTFPQTGDSFSRIGSTGSGLTTLATASALSTAQADLDTLTGSDGVTLATSQANYAPATAAALATAQADLDTLTGTDGATLATSQPNYAPNTTTPPTAAAVADAVWDEAKSGHVGAGSFGEEVQAHALSSEVATAQADLDTLTGSDGVTLATSQPNYAPNTTTPPTAAAIADAVLDEALAGHTTAGTLGKAVADTESDVTAVLADTNELQTDLANGGRLDLLIDQIITDIAALNDLSAAQVATEIGDALATDARAEPASIPAANATLADKLGWLFMVARNKVTTTSTTQTVYADDTTTAVATSGVSDDGTTFTRNEYA